MAGRFLATVLALAGLGGYALGDRGHFVVPSGGKPQAYLFDEGQQAIIVWDGKQETLVLSTNLRASEDAVDVEFLPLPSKPSEVKQAPPDIFNVIEKIIRAHAPPAFPRGISQGTGGGRTKGMAAGRPAVVVVMYAKIGAHDITVARVDDFSGFRGWIKRFLEQRGLAGGGWANRAEGLRKLVGEYLSDGYRYFVFDVIQLERSVRSVEPIIYRFASRRLYYPLRVSEYSTGRTKINLFLITPWEVNVWGTRTGFWAGRFRWDQPIKFWLTRDDLRRLDSLPAELGGLSLHFTNAVYRGPCFLLRADFVASEPRAGVARAY